MSHHEWWWTAGTSAWTVTTAWTAAACLAVFAASTTSAWFVVFVIVLLEGSCEATSTPEGEGSLAVGLFALVGFRLDGRRINLRWILDEWLFSLSLLTHPWL